MAPSGVFKVREKVLPSQVFLQKVSKTAYRMCHQALSSKIGGIGEELDEDKWGSCQGLVVVVVEGWAG